MRQRKHVKVPRLIREIDYAYGDSLIEAYWREPYGNHGDTLAQFIVLELRDCVSFNQALKSQIDEAEHAIGQATKQLEQCMEALIRLRNQCPR